MIEESVDIIILLYYIKKGNKFRVLYNQCFGDKKIKNRKKVQKLYNNNK